MGGAVPKRLRTAAIEHHDYSGAVLDSAICMYFYFLCNQNAKTAPG